MTSKQSRAQSGRLQSSKFSKSVLQKRVHRSQIRDVELLKSCGGVENVRSEHGRYSSQVVASSTQSLCEIRRWTLRGSSIDSHRLGTCSKFMIIIIQFNIQFAPMLYLQLGRAHFYSSNSNRHISCLVLPKRLKFGAHIFTNC